ncbi:glycosyltransferase family 2 protein [Lunatibacter salilacus]|uniref:glycosyltransferase family 2 protein n=1 Tax=Lunatibacter salilacus TaxID=2483804 RepID=UPI00131E2D8F|nr:glycosyltransferase family 2 protein [Lunatibacter salilacus]
MKKSLSVIIPNFNGKSLLEEYLPHTYTALEKADVLYEIIVVDDASSDDSVSFLEQNYPAVRVIKNSKNSGFSFSCNQGLFEARHELVFLLNSDVKLTFDYFEKQWKYFDKEDTFGVMGKILEMDSNKIEVAARSLKNVGFKIKTNKLFYQTCKTEQTPTAFLSGANALIDAEKMKKLGGFDEIFSPYYSEDLDLGLRAWRVGWKSYYDHESTCFHRGSFTTKTQCKKIQVKQIYFRNRFMVHAIHLESHLLPFWFAQILLFDVLPKLLMGQFWYLKSYMSFINQLDAIHSSKQKLTSLMNAQNSSKSIFDIQRQVQKDLSKKKLIWL